MRKVREPKLPFAYLEFNIEEEDLVRLKKAFKGVVENPSMTYNIQEVFNTERYFTIKVTSLGENLCLTKEREEGELEVLVVEARDWLGQWYSHIREWRPEEVDNERVTWIRCYGIFFHA